MDIVSKNVWRVCVSQVEIHDYGETPEIPPVTHWMSIMSFLAQLLNDANSYQIRDQINNA